MATVYGSESSDSLTGSSGFDCFFGLGGNDTLSGGRGNDNLRGGAGTDRLNGGEGNDLIEGGQGRDYLTGGSYGDYFKFALGDSRSTSTGADIILDWSAAFDFIDVPITGTLDNYASEATSLRSIEAARSHVEGSSALRGEVYVFLANERTDTGYLLADLDGDHAFETGIVLRGAGSVSDMHGEFIL